MKRIAFITGAGGFIGSETARRLARDGYAIDGGRLLALNGSDS